MKGGKKVVLDEDLAKVGVALRRAAKQARRIAIQTNTPLVIYENGRVVKKKLGREKARYGAQKSTVGAAAPEAGKPPRRPVFP
ncbi:MAG: hypothetical protein MUO52_17515 [Desulfobacterales bacterium]|nr:hypothetical protein [Desulfobacterales bacterium]